MRELLQVQLCAANEKKEKIAYHIGQVLEILGLDLSNPSLSKTPERVAAMYVDEVFSGLGTPFPEITFLPEEEGIVVIRKIFLRSFCEHHLVPMIGEAHVAYLPRGKILGLSNIHQIVAYLGNRPQIQERLTSQIAESLSSILETEDVAVSTYAKHLCVIARGVKDCQSEAEVHVFKGLFESDPSYRTLFFNSSSCGDGHHDNQSTCHRPPK